MKAFNGTTQVNINENEDPPGVLTIMSDISCKMSK